MPRKDGLSISPWEAPPRHPRVGWSLRRSFNPWKGVAPSSYSTLTHDFPAFCRTVYPPGNLSPAVTYPRKTDVWNWYAHSLLPTSLLYEAPCPPPLPRKGGGGLQRTDFHGCFLLQGNWKIFPSYYSVQHIYKVFTFKKRYLFNIFIRFHFDELF